MTTKDPVGSRVLILRFFQNPIVGILGSIASIVGLIAAFYFYSQSNIFPELSFSFNPTTTDVYRAGEASEIKILHQGKEIQDSVFATQMLVWNAGKKRIKTEEILKPIQIRVSGSSRILEARILKSTREVIGLALDDSMKEKGVLGLTWRILEQNDGGLIQIIYAAKEKCDISLSGVLESQPQIKNVAIPRMPIEMAHPLGHFGRTTAIIGGLASALLFGFASILGFSGVKIEKLLGLSPFLESRRHIILSKLVKIMIGVVLNRWVLLIACAGYLFVTLNVILRYQYDIVPFFADSLLKH